MSVARYIDPDSTRDVTIEGVTFTIGFWPALRAERVNLSLAKLRRIGAVDLATAEPETAFAALGINRELCEEAVRYSVRSWKWDGAPDAARSGDALSDKSLDALRLSGLLYSLASECMSFNTISDEEKKSSGS